MLLLFQSIGKCTLIYNVFSLQCTGGKVFDTCGTACPLTCDDPLPGACIELCVTG